MKYTPGPMVGQASGSQGNTTASRNRFGAYLRNRVIPVNPSSPIQNTRREDFMALTMGWRLLTGAQQAGWITLGGQMVRTDSLGQTYTLTGQEAFISLNLNRRLMGFPDQLTAPSISNTPSALTSITPAFSAGGGTGTVAFAPTPMPTNQNLFIYASAPVSPGRAFFGKSDFKFIQRLAPAAASPANIFAAYTAIYGDLIEGNAIAVRAKVVHSFGFAGTPLQAKVIVAA